jgi:hypothetical protein
LKFAKHAPLNVAGMKMIIARRAQKRVENVQKPAKQLRDRKKFVDKKRSLMKKIDI